MLGLSGDIFHNGQKPIFLVESSKQSKNKGFFHSLQLKLDYRYRHAFRILQACSNTAIRIGYVQSADNPKKSTNEKSG